MERLTDRQSEILEYLIDYSRLNLYQPSMADMADHFGINPNGVYEHFLAMERKGYVELTGRARAIVVLDKSYCLRETWKARETA